MLGTFLKIITISLLLGFLIMVYQSGGTGTDPLREARATAQSWKNQVSRFFDRLGGKSERLVAELPLPDSVRPGGQVYVWEDEKGQTHWSDQLPEGVDNARQVELADIENSMDARRYQMPDSTTR